MFVVKLEMFHVLFYCEKSYENDQLRNVHCILSHLAVRMVGLADREGYPAVSMGRHVGVEG